MAGLSGTCKTYQAGISDYMARFFRSAGEELDSDEDWTPLVQPDIDGVDEDERKSAEQYDEEKQEYEGTALSQEGSLVIRFEVGCRKVTMYDGAFGH
jgi:hypothetical protein